MYNLFLNATRDNIYLFGLFKIINAAITPGIQPKHHNINTINIDPQPLSKTAKGGQNIDKTTRQKLIILLFIYRTSFSVFCYTSNYVLIINTILVV